MLIIALLPLLATVSLSACGSATSAALQPLTVSIFQQYGHGVVPGGVLHTTSRYFLEIQVHADRQARLNSRLLLRFSGLRSWAWYQNCGGFNPDDADFTARPLSVRRFGVLCDYGRPLGTVVTGLFVPLARGHRSFRVQAYLQSVQRGRTAVVEAASARYVWRGEIR